MHKARKRSSVIRNAALNQRHDSSMRHSMLTCSSYDKRQKTNTVQDTALGENRWLLQFQHCKLSDDTLTRCQQTKKRSGPENVLQNKVNSTMSTFTVLSRLSDSSTLHNPTGMLHQLRMCLHSMHNALPKHTVIVLIQHVQSVVSFICHTEKAAYTGNSICKNH